jgi:ribonuclease VapC
VSSVLDASAVLAWLHQEPGADAAFRHFDGGMISSVNWSEVLQKVRAIGADPVVTGSRLERLGLIVHSATRGDATLAARYWSPRSPLSLADRFCLALAYRSDVPAVTAERAWANLDIGVDVEVIR